MKRIRVWWHKNKGLDNFGDLLGPYLVEKISGKKVVWTPIRKYSIRKVYIVIGSVLAHVTSKTIVWGAGIMRKDVDFPNSTFLAVRGPASGRKLTSLGYKDPGIYGDPALLLPDYYLPKIKKKYLLGLIPHYVDNNVVHRKSLDSDTLKINMLTTNPEQVIDQICSCQYIISSSLHGIIVAHSYGIPCMWIKMSDNLMGDGVKFEDYFLSVGIEPYVPLGIDVLELKSGEIVQILNSNLEFSLPQLDLSKIRSDLMSVCPFIN